MGVKVCLRCQTKNDPGNRSCIKCGRNLLYDNSKSGRQKQSKFYLYIFERFFSSVLVACAVISVFFAVMAILNQPVFTVFSILN